MTSVRLIKHCALVALVMVALALTALRLLLPQIVNYQQVIEERITAAVGLPVRFEQLSARMSGVYPEFVLDQVSILTQSGDASILQFDRLMLRVSIPGSLLRRELSPALLRISGAEFAAARTEGQLTVVGLSDSGQLESDSSDQLVAWVMRQQHLEITDTHIDYRDNDQDVDIDFSVALLRLLSVSSGLQLSGRMAFDGVASGELELVGVWMARGIAKPRQQAPWNLYVDIKNLRSEQSLANNLHLGGFLELQGWAFGVGASINHMDGRFSWVSPLLQRGDSMPLIEGDSLRGSLAWGAHQDGWRGRLNSLEFESAQGSWQGEQLVVNYLDSAIHVDGGGVDLMTGSRLLSELLPAEGGYRRTLSGLAPTGRVDQFRLDLQQGVEGNWIFSALQASFREVDISSHEDIPALSGLSGRLSLGSQRGQLQIDSKNLALWFPGLFRQALEFDHFRAEMDWQRSSSGWDTWLRDLDVANRDLELRAYGGLELPAEGAPRLQLTANLADFDIAELSRYLPVGVMQPPLVRWLDDALRGGRLVQAGLVWNGALDKFPYDQGEGRFLVIGEVEGGELDYVPRDSFPPISDLDARLRFSGAHMEIQGHSGRILDSKIREVTAIIEDLRRNGNHIDVAGKVEGPLASGLEYIQQSPLKRSVGRQLADLSTTGDSSLQLALEIPFKKGQQVKVDGELHLPGNHLRFKNSRIELADVHGDLTFSEQRINAEGITATVFGGPAQISLDSSAKGGVDFKGDGTLQMAEISRYIGWQEVDIADGPASWQAALTLGEPGMKLSLDADLDKTSINLPAPLAKAVDVDGKLQLELSCACADANAPFNLELVLDNRWYVDLELGRTDKGEPVRRGVISAAERGSLPEQGVLLAGYLPAIDFGRWQQWSATLPTSSAAGGLINQLDVEIARLDIYGQRFPDLVVTGRAENSRWDLSFASTHLEGGIAYSPTPGRLDVDLKKLSIFGDADSSPEGADGFGDIPEMDIAINSLLLNGRPLGALQLQAELREQQLVFDAIELDAGHTRFSGTGRWSSSADDEDAQHTWFTGELVTTDFGETLTMAGYSKAVSGGKGEAHWQLDWPDSPPKFALSQLNGTLSLDMEGGSLLGVEPGLGRLFGVLSLSTLQRRMSLDFRDLVGTGFVFDNFETQAELGEGRAVVDRIDLTGPAADINLSGEIDLAGRELQLTAGVVPKVTESLPLAVSIGSVGLGAAVYIGQKLLGNRIENVTMLNYEISGPIEEPAVKSTGESRIRKLLRGGRGSDVDTKP